MEPRKLWAFLVKDFLSEASYRLAFAFRLFHVLGSLLIFYFIDRLFGNRMVTHLAPFGIGYFSYVLVGIAFFGYAGTAQGSLPGRIRSEQAIGTLEAILATPIRLSTFIAATSLWNFAMATLDLVIYLIIGAAFFQADFSRVNLLAAGSVFALTTIAFTSLGLCSASFALVFKHGNPIAWVLGIFSGLLTGVYFPISVLPDWLRSLAYLLPTTHALEAMQLAVHRHASLLELAPQLGLLCALSLLLGPASLWGFRAALAKAKRDGSLGHY